MSYKGQWGYQHLVVSLANTQEVLFQDLRPGSRTSNEGAADRLDEAVTLLRRAGFATIMMRGDTAYSQFVHLDRWDAECVEFVFGLKGATHTSWIWFLWVGPHRDRRRPVKKSPPTPPRPDVVRRPQAPFGWLEAHLLHEHWLARLEAGATAVLLLLLLLLPAA